MRTDVARTDSRRRERPPGLLAALIATLLPFTGSATGGTPADATAPPPRTAPAPLFRDPVHDGAADPTLVWNREEKRWWILYTARRADADDEPDVRWVHGSDIGLASTPDGGRTWDYRGTARGLGLGAPGARDTFWAPEVVWHEGRYHAFISFVRGVPDTWKGTRDILHYTSPNLVDWTFERNVVPGAIDACVHRLPDGRFRMWFKNEQRKVRGTVRDSDDLHAWRPARSAMPEPKPGQGEGPDVMFWKGSFWMVKDTWKGIAVFRSPDADRWERTGVILDRPGKRTGDGGAGSHPGLLALDAETAWIFYFVHQPESAWRHTWLQVASLRFDGRTLTCDRDEAVELALHEPDPAFAPETPPASRPGRSPQTPN